MLISGDFTFTASPNSLLRRTTNTNTITSYTSILFPPNILSLPTPAWRLSRARGADVSSSAKPKRRGDSPISEMAGISSFDDEFDGDGEIDGEDDGDGDEDGDTLLLPLEKMREWLKNKPPGFGEGKVYDTAIEDQLFDEILQSREAQAANLNKLKHEGVKSKRDDDKKKANEVVPSGVRVRISNLPKKKNVHRDLSSAFKGVDGLISINPAVIGNKKTRDPVCKGFGFVYFKSPKDANRFVETFSRQSIAFGKVQKQIICEVVKDSVSHESPHEKSTDGTKIQVLEDGSNMENEWEINISVEFENGHDDEDDDDDDEAYESEWDEEEEEDEEEDLESVTELELNPSGSYELKTESEPRDISPPIGPVKRLGVIDKTAKVPKIKVAVKGKKAFSGSAKRLKGKEKAVMNDVFSKYGKKSAVGSKK